MHLKRRLVNEFGSKWMLFSVLIVLAFPLFIGLALYLKASPIFELDSISKLLFSSNWHPTKGVFGFWPFIYSSLYVTVLAFVFSAPICLFAAIYITQFASARLINFMYPIIDILDGIPSVIYGMWGIIVIVPFTSEILAPIFNVKSSGYSVLSGGLVLSVMCIPYMMNMLIETFKRVPIGLSEAALSLGATHWESIKHVILRKSRPGIISAFGLSIAKAYGETLAVMMVVGNSIKISSNPFDSAYPLPALIANNYGEMLSIEMYDSALMFGALILFVVVLLINLIFRFLIYKNQNNE